MKKFKFVNWNIGNPSNERLKKQIMYLSNLDADIIVLTESGDKNKNIIIEENFKKIGFDVFYNDNYIDKYSTVLLVKHEIPAKYMILKDINFSSRTSIIELIINSKKIILIGTYFPANNRKQIEKKKAHTEELFNILNIFKNNNLILMGDFNSVKRTHIPKFNWFRNWEYEIFDKLEALYLIDINETLNPKINSYSWYGSRNHGHLYDYSYISKSLTSYIYTSCFLDETTEIKLSDHLMQIVELRC